MAEAAGPFRWPDLELEIPPASPVAVGFPACCEWPALARANRLALDAATVDVGGLPLGELRRAARPEALALAASYTCGLGLKVPEGGTDQVLCTGHQPVLAHPGIWIKYLAMARMVPPGGVGLDLIVDTDAVEEIAAEVPRANGLLRRERIVMSRAGPDVPAETLPAPDPEQWRAFLEAIESCLQTAGGPALAPGWDRSRLLPVPPSGQGIAGAVTAARRALEGPRPYLSLPVSRLARTGAFRRFVLSVAHQAGRFAAVHNATLATYRAHYGIRTGAQPFPDLAVEPGRIEIPFWLVAGGQRQALFIGADTTRFYAGGRDVGPVARDPDDPAFAAMEVRPRALALTAFARLVVSDLFIHGIGGGRYDRATDAVVKAFYGVSPPAYATVTATLHLPFPAGAPLQDERHRLQRLLLDLQHNPDRFLPAGDGPYSALVAEKWALIRRLDAAANLTRRERRAATQRIRELNLILTGAVADRLGEAQEALRRHNRREQEVEVTGYRGYPFLLFPVEAVEGLVDQLRGSARGREVRA